MFLKPPAEMIDTSAPALTRSSTLLILVALLAPLILYFDTARSIVAIWNSSETFAHGYAIVPISLWLIWRRRANFALLPTQPAWTPLLLLAVAGAGWLAARIGGVQVVMQYAFVAMFPLIVLCLLGRRLAATLTFPLLFLLFAVPFGEVFVTPLINYTADFTVWAVQMTGIPVLRNGTRFELPTGSWSVVEACSGVRYLISSITLGCLYAYLTYRSNLRRACFIGLAIVVPIIANWLRAYMIVMIGHMSGMELATGVDHLIYGWLFFGLVMFLMFWIGSYWREDEAPAPSAATLPGTLPTAGTASLLPITLAIIAVVAIWPAFAAYNERANLNPQPVSLALPQLAGLQAAAPFADWEPAYMTPDARVAGVYTDGSIPVKLQILYYRNQDKSKNLISSLNRLADYKDTWHATNTSTHTATLGARTLTLRESRLSGPGGPLLVWDWMWVDGHTTSSNVVGKLRQAQSKLMFHGDDGALVVLAAPYDDDPDKARAALSAFLARSSDAIDSALVAARGR